jgi:hypothetical protein
MRLVRSLCVASYTADPGRRWLGFAPSSVVLSLNPPREPLWEPAELRRVSCSAATRPSGGRSEALAALSQREPRQR